MTGAQPALHLLGTTAVIRMKDNGLVSNAPPAAVFGLRMEHSGALAVCVFSQGTINHFIEFTPTPVTPSNSCLRTKWVFCSQRDSSIGGDSVHIWLSPSASPLSLSQSHSTTEGSQPNPFMKVNVFLFEVHVTFPPLILNQQRLAG